MGFFIHSRRFSPVFLAGLLGLVVAVFVAVAPAPSLASGLKSAASGWDGGEQAQVRLIAARTTVHRTIGHQTIGPQTTGPQTTGPQTTGPQTTGPQTTGQRGGGSEEGVIRAGLQIRLAPGWKTYWRSAGDAGFPPGFDWSGSKNLKRVEVHWPAPKRFTAFDLDSFGYSHEVVFPLSLIPERPDEEMRLELAVNYGICADICIPAQGRLSLLLPAGPGEESIEAALISAFEKRLPAPSRKGGMELVEAVAEAGGAFKVVARSRAPFSEPDLFVEEESGIYFGRPRVELREEGRVAVFRFETESPRNRRDEEKGLDGVEVTLTLTDGERAVERRMVIGSRR